MGGEGEPRYLIMSPIHTRLQAMTYIATTPTVGPLFFESMHPHTFAQIHTYTQAIARLLAAYPTIGLLLIESTGVGEPLPVAMALQALQVGVE